MALEQAMNDAKNPMDPTATTLGEDDVHSYKVLVDHGRPIDKAFIGLKPNIEADSDGTVKQAKTFETYVATEGITKAFVTFVFQYEKPDTEPDNVRDRDDYETRFKAANGDSLDGATYAGRWVMMQQFPLVEGWDPEKREYIE